jgi:hypothetical protein
MCLREPQASADRQAWLARVVFVVVLGCYLVSFVLPRRAARSRNPSLRVGGLPPCARATLGRPCSVASVPVEGDYAIAIKIELDVSAPAGRRRVARAARPWNIARDES